MEIRIRSIRPEDIPRLIDLCRRVYAGMPPWKPEQLESQMRVFPQGQIVAETPDRRVIGLASSLILSWDDYDPLGSWKDFTAGGYFTNHDPARGRTLYGAEICVDSEHRRQKVGRRLYDSRKALCRRLNLRRIRAGGRIPGYHAVADTMTAGEYVDRVVAGTLYDPTLTFQIRNGFKVLQVVPSYLKGDADSKEYATLIEWLNPDYREETP
jgi:GNAT superfamily N-acetyltransferase